MSFFTLAVLTVFCLVLRPLQGYGVLGVALLLYLAPLLTLTLLGIGAGGYLLWRKQTS